MIFKNMVLPAGFEPAYLGLEDPCLSSRLRERQCQLGII